MMAGDWIKIEHALVDKPEVFQIADSLGVSDHEAIGLVVKFWCWVDRNVSASCPAVSGTIVQVDRVVSRTGFGQAMVDVGWLESKDGKLTIPNYELHLSQTAKQRAVEAKRKAIQRAKMSHDVQDKKRTKGGPEKRREEYIKTKAKSDYSDDFNAFWEAVAKHKRKSKADAFRRYKEAVALLRNRLDDPGAFLLERATAYYTSPLGKTPYCNGPAPWLHQGGYDDDPAAWQRDDCDASAEPAEEPYPEY